MGGWSVMVMILCVYKWSEFLFLYVYKWGSMCTSDPCVQVILFCVYKWSPCLFIMENPIKMDDLGGKPTIFGNSHLKFGLLCDIYFGTIQEKTSTDW